MARKRKAVEVSEGPFPPDEAPTEGQAATDGGEGAQPSVETPKPAEPVKPQHTKLAVRMAKSFGLNDEAVNGMSSDELDEWIQEENLRREGERRIQQAQARVDGFGQPKAQIPVAPAPEPEEDYSDLDPRIGALPKTVKELKAELAELKKFREESEKRETQRTENAFADRIDDVFDSLPAEWRDIFGEGSARDMVGTPEQINRATAFAIAVQGLKEMPGKAVLKQRILAAAKQQFGKFIKAPAPAATEQPPEPTGYEMPSQLADRPRDTAGRFTAEQWSAASVLSPTARKAPELPPGRERMAQALAARLKDRQPVMNGTIAHDDDAP